MIKLIPILFSTPMVQAILAGRKTVTRRTTSLDLVNENPDYWECAGGLYTNQVGNACQDFISKDGQSGVAVKCPYGKPGDILWVRESFVRGCEWNGDGEMPPLRYYYKADDDWKLVDWHDEKTDKVVNSPRWKPSIHMSYSACRIWLKIKTIRVERLQDISEEQAIAEGAITEMPLNTPIWRGPHHFGFFRLWEKINGLSSWNANPWVWIVEFEKTEKPTN